MSTKSSNTFHTRTLYVYTHDSTTGVKTESSKAMQVMNTKRSRTGVEMPGWSVKIRGKNFNATTPLTAQEGTLQAFSPGSWECKNTGTGYHASREGLDDQAWFQPSFNSADALILDPSVARSEAQALSKAYSKIQHVMNPFGASVMLGELRETIGFLKNPIGQSQKMARALEDMLLRKTRSDASGDIQKLKKVARVTKEYANSLLQLRFGILPLVNDTIAILELAETIARRNDMLTFRCYGTDSTSSITTETITDFDGFLSYDKITETTLVTESIIRFGIKEVIDGDGSKYATVSANLQNLANVPGVILELTYLSWLVDYFVNISSILTSVITSTKGVIWQSKSVIRTKNVRVICCNFRVTAANRVLLRNANQVTTFSFRDVTRTADALTIPSVVLKVPGYTQLQNVAAFVIQKLLT